MYKTLEIHYPVVERLSHRPVKLNNDRNVLTGSDPWLANLSCALLN